MRHSHSAKYPGLYSHPQPHALKNGFLPVSQRKRAALHWSGLLILYSRFGSLAGSHAAVGAGAHAFSVHATLPESVQLQVLQPSVEGNDSPTARVFPPYSHVFAGGAVVVGGAVGTTSEGAVAVVSWGLTWPAGAGGLGSLEAHAADATARRPANERDNLIRASLAPLSLERERIQFSISLTEPSG